jgi:hypothetical protein
LELLVIIAFIFIREDSNIRRILSVRNSVWREMGFLLADTASAEPVNYAECGDNAFPPPFGVGGTESTISESASWLQIQRSGFDSRHCSAS